MSEYCFDSFETEIAEVLVSQHIVVIIHEGDAIIQRFAVQQAGKYQHNYDSPVRNIGSRAFLRCRSRPAGFSRSTWYMMVLLG